MIRLGHRETHFTVRVGYCNVLYTNIAGQDDAHDQVTINETNHAAAALAILGHIHYHIEHMSSAFHHRELVTCHQRLDYRMRCGAEEGP